jgi:hypothetical protein
VRPVTSMARPVAVAVMAPWWDPDAGSRSRDTHQEVPPLMPSSACIVRNEPRCRPGHAPTGCASPATRARSPRSVPLRTLTLVSSFVTERSPGRQLGPDAPDGTHGDAVTCRVRSGCALLAGPRCPGACRRLPRRTSRRAVRRHEWSPRMVFKLMLHRASAALTASRRRYPDQPHCPGTWRVGTLSRLNTLVTATCTTSAASAFSS